MDARRGLRYTVVSLGAVALGGGLALLASGRAWTTVHVDRPAPLPDLSVGLTGRTLQAAVPGLAVVALAGVVALLATRGVARRIVGVVIALAGVALAVAAGEAGAVSSEQARRLVADTRTGTVLDPTAPLRLVSQHVWPVLAIVGAVLVVAGGVLAASGRTAGGGLGRRYEAPTTTPDPPASGESDLALWQRLDRGDDPTARTQS
jgi:uncharacterized membrane protein (TIGR02234 family)